MTAPPESVRVDVRQNPSPLRRVTYRRPEPLPSAFFESQRARAAMGARDVHEVFAVLAGMGMSQRRIAAMTRQSQSEISEIRAGRRVRSVDVIERIADGLGTPRGWWGLAHTDDAVAPAFTAPEFLTPAVHPGPIDTVARAARAPRRVPASARSALSITSVEVTAARHPIGLINALSMSVVPRTTSTRPARNAGIDKRRTARLKRPRGSSASSVP